MQFSSQLNSVTQLRPLILEMVKKEKTPFYVFDKPRAIKNITDFKSAFSENGVNINMFYAIKSNFYSGLLKTVTEQGGFLDASSQRELKLALKAGAKKIIYTGPGKTEEDFELILKYPNKITVNLESLRELKLLSRMASEKKKTVNCGLRITTKSQTGWTKFGQPFAELRNFYNEAKKLTGVKFCGIHFHISFNKTSEPYTNTLETIAEYMEKNFNSDERKEFEYIDIGGGFFPQPFEGVHAWNPNQETYIPDEAKVIKEIFEDKSEARFIPTKSAHITEFAKNIAAVYKKSILPLMPNVKLYAEPGRYISHSAMHMVFKLIDLKNDKMGIVDGGNNMVGWEKYQFFNYAPLFNLSQFTTEREIPYVTYGPLCTPDDFWGYYLYTSGQPKEGDILMLPFQGAYTYTLAQNFIKEVPPVVDLLRYSA